MGRGKGRSTSSSHDETTNHTSKSSSSSLSRPKRDRRSTDLRLGLGIASSSSEDRSSILSREQMEPSDWALNKSFSGNSSIVEEDESDNNATFYVKVYMEGIPIGRKLDLLAHDGYYDMIRTLDYMFNTSIVWSDVEGEQTEGCHVLTYEDKEGDWLMVGDVPWEMFLSSVRRLKITRIEF